MRYALFHIKQEGVRAMTVAMREEQLLNEVLSSIDASTTAKGELSPSVVISVVDDICLGLEMGFYELPVELQKLRTDAQGRRKNGDVGYREEDIADKIVMCGLWAW